MALHYALSARTTKRPAEGLYHLYLDGHHSFEAAKLAGVAPEFVEQAIRENDNIAMLENGQIEMFLEHAYVDTDWYDIETGYWVF